MLGRPGAFAASGDAEAEGKAHRPAPEATRGLALQEWRSHWTLVLAAMVGVSFVTFPTYTVGFFFEPLTREFGWSRTAISAGISIASIVLVLLVPFAGYLVDRIGTRRLVLPGAALTGLGVAAFSFADGSAAQWIALWVAWAFAAVTVQTAVWITAVTKVFHTGRGLALGLTLSGGAIAQIISPPLASALIGSFGWREAYLWLGLGWGGLTLVLASFFLFDAGDTKGRPPTARAAAETLIPGLTLSQALRDSSLWRIAISTLLILSVTVGFSVHQLPILSEAKVSVGQATLLLSLSGAAGIAGKLITGVLLDRFHARWIGSITLASTAVAYPLLLAPFRTPELVVIAVLINGYAAGMKLQLCGYLTARYAGLRHYGVIFGAMTSVTAMAAAAGPLLAGLIFDRFQSYAPLLIGGSVISLLSGLLVLSLGRYPEFPQDQDPGHRPVLRQ